MNTNQKLIFKQKTKKSMERKFAIKMILPSILVLALIFIGPVIFTIYLSFHTWSMSAVLKPSFIGFKNYVDTFKQPLFLNSLRVSFIFTFAGVALQTILGVGIAQFINRKYCGDKLFRSFLILPLASTPVAISLVWRLMLHPTLGVLNYFVGVLGISTISWLSDVNLVMIALLIVDTWQWFPLVMFIAISAMSTIPEQLYESASIDGTTRGQSFRLITLPLIRPAVVVAMMLRLTDSLKHFDMIYVMTQGGPGNASQIINLYIYENSFRYFRMGYSSAVIVILFIIILMLNLLMSKFRREEI